MNQIEFGKKLAELRKQAGYTQMSLAELLGITDKAISKWERGLCLPDSTTLPRLAGLLDTDLGTLIPDHGTAETWKGRLMLEPGIISLATEINGKPLIEYLLSYFLLLGITEISINPECAEGIDLNSYARYGLKISWIPTTSSKVFVVYGRTLLFGSYLTHQMSNMMVTEEDIVPVIDGNEVPFIFMHGTNMNFETRLTEAKRRSLYRGIVNLPLDTPEQVKDAETFIRIYEKYHHVKFCDLNEIAKNRKIIE